MDAQLIAEWIEEMLLDVNETEKIYRFANPIMHVYTKEGKGYTIEITPMDSSEQTMRSTPGIGR